MRNFFLLVVTAAGAWGGLHLATNWVADLINQNVTQNVSPTSGMLVVPGLLLGGLLGLVIASMVMPKVH